MTEHENSGEIINLKAIWRDYLRHWWWFALSLIVCVGLAFAYVKFHTPKYRVNANILIAPQQGEMSIMKQAGAFSSLLGAKSSVDDELMIMQSHSLMKSVVNDLGLTRTHVERYGPLNIRRRFCYPKFKIDVIPASEEMFDTLSAPIQFKVNVAKDGKADIEVLNYKKKTIAEASDATLPTTLTTDWGTFTIAPTSEFVKGRKLKTEITLNGSDAVAETMAELTTIELASKKTNVINISLPHQNVDFARDMLDRMMANFNDRGVLEKSEKANKSLGFLEQRINIVGAQLAEADSAYEHYLADNGLTNITADIKYQMELKGAVEQGLIKSESEAEIAGMLLAFLKDPENQYALMPAALGNNSDLTTAYNDLILKRMQLERNAKGDNRALNALNEQIAAVRESVVEALQKSYESAQINLREVRQRQASSNAFMGRVPQQQRELGTIMRDRGVKEQVFYYLLGQREETAMQVTNAMPKGTVVDKAYAQTKPVGPSNKILLAVALLMGLCIPPFILYVRKLTCKTVNSPADARSAASVPVAATIRVADTESPVAIEPSAAFSPVTEDFRKLRSGVTDMLAKAGRNIVMVTSDTRREGRTFIALNLACSLAMLGKKVALVELDMRNPSLATTLGLRSGGDIASHVAGGRQLDPATFTFDKAGESIDIFTAGSTDAGHAELLLSERLADVMARISADYDYVVIDTTPTADVADTLSIAHLAGITLYVCRAGVTRRQAIRRLTADGLLNNPVVVVNAVVDESAKSESNARK